MTSNHITPLQHWNNHFDYWIANQLTDQGISQLHVNNISTGVTDLYISDLLEVTLCLHLFKYANMLCYLNETHYDCWLTCDSEAAMDSNEWMFITERKSQDYVYGKSEYMGTWQK